MWDLVYWENGKWHGDFSFPEGVMTKLPEEKEPVMSEFKENKEIERVLKDVVEYGHGFAMVSIEGVEQVSIAHVINPFSCEELGDDSHIENHISPLCKTIGEQS